MCTRISELVRRMCLYRDHRENYAAELSSDERVLCGKQVTGK
jgi:hypothetical protein